MRSGVPVRWRVPMLVAGFAALLTGMLAGLGRIGWGVPAWAAMIVPVHGPLMVCGFFGTIISLERAVAIGEAWAFSGPLAAGAGGLMLAAGVALPAAQFSFCLAGLTMTAASLVILWRQRSAFNFTLMLAAAGWLAGSLLWSAGSTPASVAQWWAAFLVITIAGERLELSRLLPRGRQAVPIFFVILTVICSGLLSLAAAPAMGQRAIAVGYMGLALWLLRFDVARRTVIQRGLTRYIAVCLLTGYAWLALAGVVALWSAPIYPGSAAYDGYMHALFLGFVFSMVFGHGPIIFPAILGVRLRYGDYFYVPLVALAASVAVRLTGAILSLGGIQRAAALLHVAAILAFVLCMLASALRARRAGG